MRLLSRIKFPKFSAQMDTIKSLPTDESEFAGALVSYFFEPNGFYNEALSIQSKNEAEEGTEPGCC